MSTFLWTGRVERLKRWARIGCAGTAACIAGRVYSQAIYAPYSFATVVSESRSRVGTGPLHAGIISHLAVDAAGNVFYNSDQLLLKRSPSGFVATVAGGNAVGGADGIGPKAGFTSIDALAVSTGGVVYVLDAGSVRRVAVDSTVTTIAPRVGPSFVTGTFTIAADSQGNAYLANAGTQVTKVSPGGSVSTLSTPTGTPITFQKAAAVAVDPNNNLLVMDVAAGTVVRVTPAETTSVAATLPAAFSSAPAYLAADAQGNLYIENPASLEKLSSGGAIAPVPTGPTYASYGAEIGLDPSGTLFFLGNPGSSGADLASVSASAAVATLASPVLVTGSSDGAGQQASISAPTGVAVDASGTVYFLDQGGAEVRKVSPGGVVTTVAGTPTYGSSDGTGSAAGFNKANALAVDASGNLYVADTANDTIRKVAPGGAVTTVAGSAGVTGSADGAGASARFNHPSGVAVDASGDLFVTDTGNNTVRKITPDGTVSTYAGTASAFPNYLDGTAANAQFANPTGIAVDAQGNVYVGDTFGNTTRTSLGDTVFSIVGAVRKITPSGTVSTLAGTPYTVVEPEYFTGQPAPQFGDGSGASVFFGDPAALAVDAAGNVYVADASNRVVRRVTPQGAVTTLGGTVGTASTTESDGVGAQAAFATPNGLAVDTQGNLYVSDLEAIRVGASAGYPTVPTQPLQLWGLIPLTAAANSNVTLTFPGATTAATTYQWYYDGTLISGATGPTLPLTQVTGAETAYFQCVGTNPFGTNTAEFSVNVSDALTQGRLMNLSCRAQSGTGSSQMIVGYTIGGHGTSGAAPVLLRATGPALGTLGVTGFLPDPLMVLNNSAGVVATDSSSWNLPAIEAAATSLGAFDAVTTTSDGAAIFEPLEAGNYTAQVTGKSGDTGIALSEIYDATLAENFSLQSPRLVNISARALVGTGGNELIAGFVVGGTSPLKVLIRASGPALGAFGISGLLPDPQLTLLETVGGVSAVLATNAGWSADPTILNAAEEVGAFSWGTAATPDAALLVTLQPGVYTALVDGASGDTGIALVEVYEVP